MSPTTPNTGPQNRKWTLLTAAMAAAVLWIAAIEVPDRLGRISDLRAETAHTWDRHARALDQRQVIAGLRQEHENMEERFAAIAGGTPAAAGPSSVFDQLESAIQLAGLVLLEMRPLEGERGGTYARLPIQLRLAGSFDGLRGFVRSVESGGGAMPVRQVHIRGSEESSAAVEAEVVLDVVVVERSFSAEGDQP